MNIYVFREVRGDSMTPQMHRVGVNGDIEEAWKKLADMVGKTIEETQKYYYFQAKNPPKPPMR